MLHQDADCGLELSKSPLDILADISPSVPRDAQVGRLLHVGITRDAGLRPTSSLSPGLKVRLALLLLIVQRVNCLVLDEVTNFIDRSAKETLIQFLQKFRGAVVCVTHDRELLENVKWDRMVQYNNDSTLSQVKQSDFAEWIAAAQAEADEAIEIVFSD